MHTHTNARPRAPATVAAHNHAHAHKCTATHTRNGSCKHTAVNSGGDSSKAGVARVNTFMVMAAMLHSHRTALKMVFVTDTPKAEMPTWQHPHAIAMYN